jgi:hypothetical protein
MVRLKYNQRVRGLRIIVKAARFAALTLAFGVHFSLRTMLQSCVSVSYLVEEVQLICPGKEGNGYTVDRRISPTLKTPGE